MKIQKMFAKQIDRPITGVIKVGQNAENDKKQELEEYVVTRELTRHFREFFDNYGRSMDYPTDEMGVWISGFFGSGKSHFLKILSYILDNTNVCGKTAVEYFADKDNFTADPMILANMKRTAQTPTQAILFNVDSKSTASAKSDSNAIVKVFNRVFNEKLGYDGANPALADLERILDEEGSYQRFQDAFREETGKEWLKERNKFRVIRGKVAKALTAMGRMSEQEAMDFTKAATTSNYEIAIEDFAERVHQYIEKSGKRVVFLVDEIGQFISNDSRLMLNLQTMTEELGLRCHGKAWVIVTAQEDMDSMMEKMDFSVENKNDFSKIQGRFKTRLSLSSVNADEVIRERILKKDEVGKATLKALYDSEETRIQNAVSFKGNGYELKKIRNADEFADVYPFLPYQFNLLADVLNAIRLYSSTGKHLSEGERSMLGAYQKAAISVMEQEEGTLIPFYRFYDDLLKFLDHTHASVIQRAEDSERINPMHEPDCFHVNVLKTLFLLKYIDGIPLTVDNILNLMVTDIHEDKALLRKKVEEAVNLLTRSMFVTEIQDTYEFLTDEEQDIERKIREKNIPQADVILELTKRTFDEIYSNSRYRVPKFNGRYTFAYNQTIDNTPYRANQNNSIGLRIITPRYSGANGDGSMDDTTLTMMSARNHEVIMKLPIDNTGYYHETLNYLRIYDYMHNVSDPEKGRSTSIRATKMQKAERGKEAALVSLKEAIGNSRIFINGQSVTDITNRDAASRIGAALGRLVDNIYYKLSYIDEPKDDMDIKRLFKKEFQYTMTLEERTEPNSNALREMLDYIMLTTSAHTMISMKSLLDHFAQAPFGYTDNDTKWLAAKLFKEGKIGGTVEKEPVTPFNREPDELGIYFTSRKYEEKLLFRSKITIDQKKIKACKDVMKALFNQTEVTSDSDKLMASFQNGLTDLLKDLRDMLYIQKYNCGFPGKDMITKAVFTLTSAKERGEESAFFDWIFINKNELLELADDLAPVKTFYDSETQQNIFNNNGLRALQLYEKSAEHITDVKVTGKIAEIKKIVTSKAPYEQIRRLPNLYKEFIELYGNVLDVKLEPVRQAIRADEENVINFIRGQYYEDDVKEEVRNVFASLLERASNETDISDLLGYRVKADETCKRFLDRFSNLPVQEASRTVVYTASQGQETSMVRETADIKPAVSQTRMKNMMARDISSGYWVVRNEEDLENYLNQIREKVTAELDGKTVIRIQF